MSAYELGLYLKEVIDERGIRITELSQRSSLSRESIYRLLNGDIKQPKLSTVVRISRVLGVHPLLLLRKLFKGWEFNGCVQPQTRSDKDGIGFIGDITYPDSALVSLDTEFTKTWEIQNLGAVPWVRRRLICVDDLLEISSKSGDFKPPESQRGLTPIQRSVDIEETVPGAKLRISVRFHSPSYPCTALSYWKMVDGKGEFCFPEHEGLSCLVRVLTI